MNLQEMFDVTQNAGYSIQDARAKVCQDVVLKAIASSSLSRNVTIKGGVVMRSITGNVRRATQDMDMSDIVRRITKIFQNKSYRSKVDRSDKRWLDESIDEIFEKIVFFLNSMR